MLPKTTARSEPRILWLWLVAFCSCCLNHHIAAREIVATNDWQPVGPHDTLPAGLEIRMDLTKGGKWARLMQPEQEPAPAHHPRCGPSCHARQQERRRKAGLRGSQNNAQALASKEHLASHATAVSPLILVGGVIGAAVLGGLSGAWRHRRFWQQRTAHESR